MAKALIGQYEYPTTNGHEKSADRLSVLEVVRDTRLRISEMSTPISADINIKRRRLFETLTFQARRITANAVIVLPTKVPAAASAEVLAAD